MDCSPPGSSVHGISQARILEWVAISFSRGSSWPRDGTSSPACRWILHHWTIRVWKHILFIQDPHFPSKTRTAFKVEKTLQNFTDTFYFAGERQTVGLQQAGCRPGSLPHPFNPPQVCPAASAKTDRRWCPFVQGVSQLWLPGLPLSIHSATESLTKMRTHVHVPSSPHIEL